MPFIQKNQVYVGSMIAKPPYSRLSQCANKHAKTIFFPTLNQAMPPWSPPPPPPPPPRPWPPPSPPHARGRRTPVRRGKRGSTSRNYLKINQSILRGKPMFLKIFAYFAARWKQLSPSSSLKIQFFLKKKTNPTLFGNPFTSPPLRTILAFPWTWPLCSAPPFQPWTGPNRTLGRRTRQWQGGVCKQSQRVFNLCERGSRMWRFPTLAPAACLPLWRGVLATLTRPPPPPPPRRGRRRPRCRRRWPKGAENELNAGFVNVYVFSGVAAMPLLLCCSQSCWEFYFCLQNCCCRCCICCRCCRSSCLQLICYCYIVFPKPLWKKSQILFISHPPPPPPLAVGPPCTPPACPQRCERRSEVETGLHPLRRRRKIIESGNGWRCSRRLEGKGKNMCKNRCI